MYLLRTRWFKYDLDYLCVNKSQFVPVIFEPPCNIEALLRSHCFCGKAKNITYFCCVCVCVCTIAGPGECLRAFILNYPAWSVPPYCHLRPLWLHHIFRLCHKRHDFRKKLLKVKYIVAFSNFANAADKMSEACRFLSNFLM
jgi:hypothetical protein